MRVVTGCLVLFAAVGTTTVAHGDGPSASCQRVVARAGAKLAKSALKAFQHCALRRMRGAGGAAVTCDSGDTPTGDRGTDAAVSAAVARASDRVAHGCATADLSSFATRCPDPTGPPFTLADLASCLRTTHLDRAGAMVEVEFPATAAVPQQTAGCTDGQTCDCRCTASPSVAFVFTSNGGVQP